jgi:CHAD domain-containing protein
MADMDADWPLPRPIKLFNKNGRFSDSSKHARSGSIADGFAWLATPLVAEAVQRARDLADNGDAEEFHQLRVALRKLRALYWAYSRHLGDEVTAQATEELKRLATAAGGARDWDIASDLLKTAQASRASMSLLIEAALKKRALAVKHSQLLIKADEVEVFLKEALRRAQTTLDSGCSDVPMRAFAKDRVQRSKRALEKRCRYVSARDTTHEEHLHDVRKAGKKLRYLLEFFEPVVKRDHGRTIKHLTAVQKKLGEFNDLVASEGLIRRTSFADVPPEVVEESLQWLKKQKLRRMQAARRRVLAISS